MGLFSGSGSYSNLLGPLAPIFEELGMNLNDLISNKQKIPNDMHEARASILTNSLTNALSYYTNKQNNEFNAEQAQLNRDFNAEQAQISRDWSSEEAVMARRDAAGINSAMLGGTSSGSSSGASPVAAAGSPASASPASFSSPNIPVQKPLSSQVSEVITATTGGIKNIADSASTLKQVAPLTAKLQNEAEHAGQLARYQSILNDMSPELLTAQIGEMVANADYARANKDLLPVIGQRNLLDTYKQVGDLYEQFVMTQLQQVDRQLSAEELKSNWAALGQRLYHDSVMRKNELKSQNFRFAWSLRQRRTSSSISDNLSQYSTLSKSLSNTRTNSTGYDWNVSGNASVEGRLGLPLGVKSISGKFDIGGRYGRFSNNGASVTSVSDDVTGTSSLSGSDFSDSLYEFDFNSDAYKEAVNSIANSLVIMDPSTSYRQRLDALTRIYKINTSPKAFSEYLMKNIRAPMNDIFSNSFQQY